MARMWMWMFAMVLMGVGCSEGCTCRRGGAVRKPEVKEAKIGVQECDDYVARFAACIAKMPAPAKAAAQDGFKSQEEAWRTAAATEAGRVGLKKVCQGALDGLAQNPLCK